MNQVAVLTPSVLYKLFDSCVAQRHNHNTNLYQFHEIFIERMWNKVVMWCFRNQEEYSETKDGIEQPSSVSKTFDLGVTCLRWNVPPTTTCGHRSPIDGIEQPTEVLDNGHQEWCGEFPSLSVRGRIYTTKNSPCVDGVYKPAIVSPWTASWYKQGRPHNYSYNGIQQPIGIDTDFGILFWSDREPIDGVSQPENVKYKYIVLTGYFS